MYLSLARRVSPALFSLVVLAAPLSVAGCGDDVRVLPDGAIPDGGVADAPDAVSPDGGTPGCGIRATQEPIITTCAGDALPAPATGNCDVVPGNARILITGDILKPGEVLRGGQVLIDESGGIVCSACDCSGEAAGATQLVCPESVVSPGLINTHEHISFAQNVPYDQTPERYEHRHDWRRGSRADHQRLSSPGSASRQEMAWGELRYVMGGGTSLNGSGSSDGFLRNLDRGAMEGLGQPQVEYDTFPLGDGDGTLRSSGCMYPGVSVTSDIARYDAYTPHVSEGIDREARNEFLCIREGMTDLIEAQTAVIHGIGLLPQDIGEIAANGASLIWSPRSNITLYGDTARVTEYHAQGVPIALGTDWIITGSMNMLRELQCAEELNATYYNNYFTDEDLWLMATRNAAEVLAVDDALGILEPGRVADIAIFDASMRGDYRAVLDAEPADVVAVLRGGSVLYGDANVVEGLAGEPCDAITVCETAKQVCTMREVGMSLDALTMANRSAYQLFACGLPPNEPSCVPSRNATEEYPSPVVNNSSRYSGEITGTDGDGDGIEDAMDNCQCTFNPIRPVDDGTQADFDEDGIGDACDVCPLNEGPICAPADPNDRDADGIPNDLDNCPEDRNEDQADMDGDMKGDVCDACPMDPNPGTAACPSTVYQVRMGAIDDDATVSLMGPVVTAVGEAGFNVQVAPDDAGYEGVDNSGIFVFTGAVPEVALGDRLTFERATVGTFFGQKQLSNTMFTVTASGVALPAAEVVTPAEVTTGGSRAAVLEGVLVTLSDLTVTDVAPAPGGEESAPTGEFEVTGGLRVNDFYYAVDPFPMLGEVLVSVTGVLGFRRDNSKVEPRFAEDLVFGAAALRELSPALSYGRVGVSGATFPEELRVSLTRIASEPTVIALASGGPGLTVEEVTIPAGSLDAPVPVVGVTADVTPVRITATMDGRMTFADVRILGATERPVLVSITPGVARVPISSDFPFMANLSFPAPPGGVMATLSVDMGGTVPPTVMVPGNALSGTFLFTAGATDATATLTATLDAMSQMATANVVASAAGTLMINELDYDQPGTDTMEFVEIYNRGSAPIALEGFALVFINGNTNMEYGTRVNLTGSLAGESYLVVANTGVTVPAGVMRINHADNTIQNGDPDGVMLFDTARNEVVDALSYEGSITAASVAGAPGTYSLVEGTPTSAIDMGGMSLSRLPNGTDTDNADSDFALAAPTPGAAN